MSNVKGFGAAGDGKTDDTEAIRHAIADADGRLQFSRGDYLISETIEIKLDEVGRIGIDGDDHVQQSCANCQATGMSRTASVQ